MVTTAPAARHISLNEILNLQRQISSLGSPVFSKAIEAIPEVLPSNHHHHLVTTSLTCPGGVCSTFVAAFLSLIRYFSAIPRKSEPILSRISLVDSTILRPNVWSIADSFLTAQTQECTCTALLANLILVGNMSLLSPTAHPFVLYRLPHIPIYPVSDLSSEPAENQNSDR